MGPAGGPPGQGPGLPLGPVHRPEGRLGEHRDPRHDPAHGRRRGHLGEGPPPQPEGRRGELHPGGRGRRRVRPPVRQVRLPHGRRRPHLGRADPRVPGRQPGQGRDVGSPTGPTGARPGTPAAWPSPRTAGRRGRKGSSGRRRPGTTPWPGSPTRRPGGPCRSTGRSTPRRTAGGRGRPRTWARTGRAPWSGCTSRTPGWGTSSGSAGRWSGRCGGRPTGARRGPCSGKLRNPSYVHGLSFPDKDHGWVVGDKGYIEHYRGPGAK